MLERKNYGITPTHSADRKKLKPRNLTAEAPFKRSLGGEASHYLERGKIDMLQYSQLRIASDNLNHAYQRKEEIMENICQGLREEYPELEINISEVEKTTIEIVHYNGSTKTSKYIPLEDKVEVNQQLVKFLNNVKGR